MLNYGLAASSMGGQEIPKRRGKVALPAVAVYSLGGTISAAQTGGSGVEPSLSGEALVEDVPEIAKRGRGFSRIL
jgi:L-asparaginase/Glu-tRNA(Gln) amidotransferase subunit D